MIKLVEELSVALQNHRRNTTLRRNDDHHSGHARVNLQVKRQRTDLHIAGLR